MALNWKILITLFLSIFFTSCISQAPFINLEKPPTTSELTVKWIRDRLEKNKILDAWALWYNAKSLLVDSEAQEVEELLSLAINVQMEVLKKEGRWEELIQLQELSGQNPSAEIVKKDLEERLIKAMKLGQSPLVVLYLSQGLQLSTPWILPEALQYLIDKALWSDLRHLSLANPKVPELSTFRNFKPTFTNFLDSTVTVWVNKGLRREGEGMVPDVTLGTGFFIDLEGHLITNYHVIESEVDPEYEGYSRLSIRLGDSKGERIPATVIGWDKNYDLALLKVDYAPKAVLSLYSTQPTQPGMRVIALGSPMGLSSTFTAGIISNVERKFLPLGEVYQLDAAINPGNSGGPLLTEDGDFVGVSFAGAQDMQGINFAIPGKSLRTILPKLYEGGAVQHHWLGLGLQETPIGLEVNFVDPTSGSSLAGFLWEDQLTRVGGRAFSTVAELQDYLSGFTYDRVLIMEGLSQGKSFQRAVVTRSRPLNPLELFTDKHSLDLLSPLLLGLALDRIGDVSSSQFRVRKVYNGSFGDSLNLASSDSVFVINWNYLKKEKLIQVALETKRRLGGYLETTIQIVLSLMYPYLV